MRFLWDYQQMLILFPGFLLNFNIFSHFARNSKNGNIAFCNQLFTCWGRMYLYDHRKWGNYYFMDTQIEFGGSVIVLYLRYMFLGNFGSGFIRNAFLGFAWREKLYIWVYILASWHYFMLLTLTFRDHLASTIQGVSQKCPGAVLVDFGFKSRCNRIHLA